MKVLRCPRCEGIQTVVDKDTPDDPDIYDENNRDDCPLCDAKVFFTHKRWMTYWKDNCKRFTEGRGKYLVCPVCEDRLFLINESGKKVTCNFCNGENYVSYNDWLVYWGNNCENRENF